MILHKLPKLNLFNCIQLESIEFIFKRSFIVLKLNNKIIHLVYLLMIFY